jgi:hypothetical protein
MDIGVYSKAMPCEKRDCLIRVFLDTVGKFLESADNSTCGEALAALNRHRREYGCQD